MQMSGRGTVGEEGFEEEDAWSWQKTTYKRLKVMWDRRKTETKWINNIDWKSQHKLDWMLADCGWWMEDTCRSVSVLVWKLG